MKKLLIGAVVALPVIWAGATWGISNKTESVLDEMLVKSNQDLSEKLPFVSVEKQSYEKGFLTSTATSVIKLDAEMFGGNDEPISIVFNHTIYHGPVMKTPNGLQTGSSYIYTTLDQKSLPDEVTVALKVLFDNDEPFTSGLKTGLGGDLSVDFEVSPMSLNDKKIAELRAADLPIDEDGIKQFSFAGITGNFTTDKEGTFAKGDMTIGAIDFEGQNAGEDIVMKVAPMVANIDITEIYKSAMLGGTVDIKIPELSFIKGKDEGFTLTGVTLNSVAETEDKSLGGSFSFDVDKFILKAKNAPFKLPESALHLSMGLKGLEVDAVKKVIDLGQDMQKAQFALLGSDFSEESMQKITDSTLAYFNAMGETLKEGAKVNYAFDISNETGKSSVKLDLTYAEAKKLFELKTIKELIVALSGQLNVTVAKGMIAGTPLEEAIGMPVAMGFAVENETSYELVADLATGELKVNGEPMPFLDMMGPALDQPLPWDELKSSIQ